MKKLLNLLYEHNLTTWSDDAEAAFKELFGSATGRYAERAEKSIQIRAPKFQDENNVPFATLIEPSNPKSGPYGGMSVGLFPVEGEPCLIALGTGTTGSTSGRSDPRAPGSCSKSQSDL